jgi:hypothetical protein
LTQYTKADENIPNCHINAKWPLNIPNGHNIFQMAIKYTSIFHSRALQNLPKFGFLVRKHTIWQPCFEIRAEKYDLDRDPISKIWKKTQKAFSLEIQLMKFC